MNIDSIASNIYTEALRQYRNGNMKIGIPDDDDGNVMKKLHRCFNNHKGNTIKWEKILREVYEHDRSDSREETNERR